jgi:hypothetical protein
MGSMMLQWDLTNYMRFKVVSMRSVPLWLDSVALSSNYQGWKISLSKSTEILGALNAGQAWLETIMLDFSATIFRPYRKQAIDGI